MPRPPAGIDVEDSIGYLVQARARQALARFGGPAITPDQARTLLSLWIDRAMLSPAQVTEIVSDIEDAWRRRRQRADAYARFVAGEARGQTTAV